MSLHPKLLIFDCDGVLFDSKLANEKYYNYILNLIGRHPLTPEELDFVHVHSLSQCLEYLCREKPHLLEKALQISKEISYSLFFDYMIMEDGLREFLDWAYPRYLIAICTNRTTSTIPLLNHFKLTHYFQYIGTALDYPKSDPRALISILDYFSIKPDLALYIGDSQVDENLCKTCHVPFISYKNPNLQALRVIHHYNELKSFLEERAMSFDTSS
ncbi:MAG: HAD hydrolase-like protein [Caldimicrobium sp.]|nr:HAD hydrolase-like protein [Caldimicrobium sp.]MCX7873681.1 HAD hydrolase-like protein [Caldimicrobium sp.]MDW8095094.1 HAD hydrolase-like protein [Caldimicrobium sp.]